MKSKHVWLGILSIAALGLCLLSCLAAGLVIRFAPDIYQIALRQGSLAVGSPAPDFSLSTLDERAVRLSQFRGSPVVLVFAASWCPACRGEAPVLQTLHNTHPALTVLLVDSNEGDAAVRGFASEFGMTHPVLLDKLGLVSAEYGIYAIPTGFFLDTDGTVRAISIGGITPELLAEKLPLIGIKP